MEANMTDKDQQPQATALEAETDASAEQQAQSTDDQIEGQLDAAPVDESEDITAEAVEVDEDRPELEVSHEDGLDEDSDDSDGGEPADEVDSDQVADDAQDQDSDGSDEPTCEETDLEADIEEQDSLDEEIESEEVDDQPQAEPEPEIEIETTVESVIEAVLFASDEALTPARIAGIVETDVKQVREHIESLNARYEANNAAFRIERIAGGYQMLTLSPYNHWLRKLLRVRSDSKLSPAALETLAIVAYKQPVIRADIEAIRGVAAGEVLRSLMYKGLIKIVGRAEVLGRPMLYGTTRKFLEVFGLNSIRDLPKVEELKKPTQ